jgi:hypothetical protein
VAQSVGRGIALLFHDLGTRRGEWSAARPGRNLPPSPREKPGTHCTGAPGSVWTGGNSRPPPGFDPRTVQPVVSRYTG